MICVGESRPRVHFLLGWVKRPPPARKIDQMAQVTIYANPNVCYIYALSNMV